MLAHPEQNAAGSWCAHRARVPKWIPPRRQRGVDAPGSSVWRPAAAARLGEVLGQHGAVRAGGPPHHCPGCSEACEHSRPGLYTAWAAAAEAEVTGALGGVAELAGASRALAAALARAGALGAAARLARRYVDAHAAPEREGRAELAGGLMAGVLRAAEQRLPEARARAPCHAPCSECARAAAVTRVLAGRRGRLPSWRLARLARRRRSRAARWIAWLP
jgi:hypothetical protein